MVSEYPAISRPKERVSQITIPGRSGVLMLPENGLPVYEPVLRTAQCWVRPDADIDAICAWLQGSGSVVFGNEPDRSYDARIINQIDFSKILRGRGFRSFAVPFQCQPYKRLYPPAEDITLTASEDKTKGYKGYIDNYLDAVADWNGKENTRHLKDIGLNEEISLKDGWWIPSLAELYFIFMNRKAINEALEYVGFDTIDGVWYWSSTEYSATTAWRLNLLDGYAFTLTKASYARRVRAVSAFIS